MHDLIGQSLLYDRIHRMTLGNSLELTVTKERALIRVGAFAKDAPKEDIVFKDARIVYAFLILAQVIEEQGSGDDGEGEALAPKPVPCPLCDGRGGAHDHLDNWIDCPDCGS